MSMRCCRFYVTGITVFLVFCLVYIISKDIAVIVDNVVTTNTSFGLCRSKPDTANESLQPTCLRQSIGMIRRVCNSASSNMTSVARGRRSDAMASGRRTDCCRQFVKYCLQMNINDADLVLLDSLCFSNSTSLTLSTRWKFVSSGPIMTPANDVTVGAELFERLFRKNIFGDVTCEKWNTRFDTGPGRPRVALASFPGSGNTWTRVLLEQLTGIYTGSVLPDGMVRETLIGSKLCPLDERVFIIKTHRNDNTFHKKGCGNGTIDFDRAVYLLRNPFHAIMAEYNRRKSGGKTDVAQMRSFLSPEWIKDASTMSNDWADHVIYWLKMLKKPVNVVIYEELTHQTLFELYKIANFTNHPVTLTKLWCIKSHVQNQKAFRRKKPIWQSLGNLYKRKLKDVFNKNIAMVIETLASRPNIVKYLKQYML